MTPVVPHHRKDCRREWREYRYGLQLSRAAGKRRRVTRKPVDEMQEPEATTNSRGWDFAQRRGAAKCPADLARCCKSSRDGGYAPRHTYSVGVRFPCVASSLRRYWCV